MSVSHVRLPDHHAEVFGVAEGDQAFELAGVRV